MTPEGWIALADAARVMRRPVEHVRRLCCLDLVE
jgi:hypothetical protein